MRPEPSPDPLPDDRLAMEPWLLSLQGKCACQAGLMGVAPPIHLHMREHTLKAIPASKPSSKNLQNI